ncbi:TPA: hypothetical protein KQB99_003621 [Clostridioides difficile]|uniref:hypothetical protein n=1 Tax=Clostridioides difficile TaxID=1496 RepID=UPI00038D31E2|nr:hypothetical protein [Clostridioides difficile]EGT4186050.1 hypothetical protein [Clostridioides difficile]EGT4217577.1 hypothetical protein [Clostridioides difficile]EGT4673860.1 hypothetical protein [Clostridioides difficile]EGT5565374.1 hypothetical protein [Clostridioides difficile]EQJ96895.1 hypothetical protein QUE_2231 [Clostridioides difficile P51]
MQRNKDESLILFKYKDNISELIEEIFNRAYKKNYIHEYFLKDSIDYIASCTKANLGNYTTLKYKEWDKQCSSTSAFQKLLRYEGEYPKWRYLVNEMIDTINAYYINPYNHLKQKEDRSLVKFFVRILHTKNVMEVFSKIKRKEFKVMLPRYRHKYVNCAKIANNNIFNQKELIVNILNKVISKVDWSMDEQQIIKYICKGISWEFGNLTHHLPNWYWHTHKKFNQLNGESYVRDKRIYVLNHWFGLENLTNSEIRKLKFFTSNQINTIINILDSLENVEYRKNRKGIWDLNKTQLARNLNISYDSLKKRIIYIKKKVQKNGIDIKIKEPRVICNSKFKPMSRAEMFRRVGEDEQDLFEYYCGKFIEECERGYY